MTLSLSYVRYVQDQCVGKKPDEIKHDGTDLVKACCSAKELFSCHYRDKPSIKPCKDSPPIDKQNKSFW